MLNYCWDTSVFLAYLNNDPRASQADIEIVIQQVIAGEANLIVSVTTFAEILTTHHTQAQLEAFEKFLRRDNVARVDVTFPIAQKAGAIRARAEQPDAAGIKRKLKTPDAQIIATAIIYKATVLHTLDEKLLNLDGHEIVDHLPITLPRDFRGQLGLLPNDPTVP